MDIRDAIRAARQNHSKYIYLATTSNAHFIVLKHFDTVCRVYVHGSNDLPHVSVWHPKDREWYGPDMMLTLDEISSDKWELSKHWVFDRERKSHVKS